MEKKTAVSALEKWEAPTFAEIRVSAEVTAYAAIWRGADSSITVGRRAESARRPAGGPAED
jgi:coenzyme PQQ precursor peptide PqqA